jgi:hypothetical protein
MMTKQLELQLRRKELQLELKLKGNANHGYIIFLFDQWSGLQYGKLKSQCPTF